jgi:hypothetical protein
MNFIKKITVEPTLRYCVGSCLERLRKTTEPLKKMCASDRTRKNEDRK